MQHGPGLGLSGGGSPHQGAGRGSEPAASGSGSPSCTLWGPWVPLKERVSLRLLPGPGEAWLWVGILVPGLPVPILLLHFCSPGCPPETCPPLPDPPGPSIPGTTFGDPHRCFPQILPSLCASIPVAIRLLSAQHLPTQLWNPLPSNSSGLHQTRHWQGRQGERAWAGMVPPPPPPFRPPSSLPSLPLSFLPSLPPSSSLFLPPSFPPSSLSLSLLSIWFP